jgi:hypothetical protein
MLKNPNSKGVGTWKIIDTLGGKGGIPTTAQFGKNGSRQRADAGDPSQWAAARPQDAGSYGRQTRRKLELRQNVARLELGAGPGGFPELGQFTSEG